MMFKLIGAALVILGCGSFGFVLAAAHRKEVHILRNLITALSYMKCELQFHKTSLPLLCRKTAACTNGPVGKYFNALAQELESQICPDVRSCSAHALSNTKELPTSVRACIQKLSNTLGAFDLKGQLNGLEYASRQAEQALDNLLQNQDQRLRNYQTLGLCAGAALAILLV